MASSIDITGINSQIAGINSEIAGIKARITDLDGRTTKALNGTSMAFAMTGVPWLDRTAHFAVSANWGTFQGTNGVALNAALRLGMNVQANGGLPMAQVAVVSADARESASAGERFGGNCPARPSSS